MYGSVWDEPTFHNCLIPGRFCGIQCCDLAISNCRLWCGTTRRRCSVAAMVVPQSAYFCCLGCVLGVQRHRLSFLLFLFNQPAGKGVCCCVYISSGIVRSQRDLSEDADVQH